MINKTAKRTLSAIISFLLIISMIPVLPLLPAAFAQPSEAAALEPANCQIIPYYEVWLRWNDVSDEDHYLISVRDITYGDNSDPAKLLYSNVWVNKNSTYFIIPLSKLNRGGIYRWSLCSVAADGSKNYTPPRKFEIEHTTPYEIDTHLWKTGFASANHIDYFIHERTSGYGAILEQGVNAWNGISSKVYLHRDYSNVEKQLGIYEAFTVSNTLMGKTFMGGYDNYIEDNFTTNTVYYTEIHIYGDVIRNINSSSYTTNQFSKTITMHEVGHALSLAHTDGSNTSPNAVNYDISQTSLNVYVPLLMNSGNCPFTAFSQPSTTDRDHLRLKWGA